MSCVAELNASNQKTAKVSWKKCSVGMVKAMPASPAPIKSCMVIIHQRFVLIRSMKGLNISQPTLSHHMKILCDAGIVVGRKEGKWTHYSISYSGVEQAKQYLQGLLPENNEL